MTIFLSHQCISADGRRYAPCQNPVWLPVDAYAFCSHHSWSTCHETTLVIQEHQVLDTYNWWHDLDTCCVVENHEFSLADSWNSKSPYIPPCRLEQCHLKDDGNQIHLDRCIMKGNYIKRNGCFMSMLFISHLWLDLPYYKTQIMKWDNNQKSCGWTYENQLSFTWLQRRLNTMVLTVIWGSWRCKQQQKKRYDEGKSCVKDDDAWQHPFICGLGVWKKGWCLSETIDAWVGKVISLLGSCLVLLCQHVHAWWLSAIDIIKMEARW